MIPFGKLLKEYRLDNHLTLQQIADATGLRTGTLSRIENERVKAQELTERQIRKALPDFSQWEEKTTKKEKKIKKKKTA